MNPSTLPLRLRILVVDDREPLRTALARGLRSRHSVATASCAHAALKLMAEERFDAILSDYDMPPGPDGLWLLREVAQRFPETRRFLVTGERPNLFTNVVASGLIEFCFQKPLGPVAVVAALESGRRR